MFSRQPVKVTYAHKRRREHASKMQSSPLEVLPPERDDLTRSQMTRRMLKRSRRVALAEQLEDKNIDHTLLKERLTKRIKRTQDRIPHSEPSDAPSNVPITQDDDLSFQTPFNSSPFIHESAVSRPLVPEQLSPVPIAKRIISRTSSRNLKENTTHTQTLASPFNSRPGSAASSPKLKARERSSRKTSRISRHAKSRTLSGVFKENSRRVSRKSSTLSLKDTDRDASAGHVKHQRYPSSPSASYMRSQYAEEDWIAPPKALTRQSEDHDTIRMPGSAQSIGSFFNDFPQYCSTPVNSRSRKRNLQGSSTGTDGSRAPAAQNEHPTEAVPIDVEMIDGTLPDRRQTVHLSGNSIFSSSGDFTIRSLPTMNNGTTAGEANGNIRRKESTARVPLQAPADERHAGYTLAGTFVEEYDISIPGVNSPALTTATKRDREGVPKVSVGERAFALPGTSPQAPRPEADADASGSAYTVRASTSFGTLTPPASPERTRPRPPTSPGAALAQEFQSMDLGGAGDADTHSDGEAPRPSPTVPLQSRSHSLQDAPNIAGQSSTKKITKRRPARNRAGTIRASDFIKLGTSSGAAPAPAAHLASNVRRTRSGTVVGPNSKLATKNTAPVETLPDVLSESESDDELLLRGPWVEEDLEYLGLPVFADRKDVEEDEMNLGGAWHGLEIGPPQRTGLRRR